MTCRVPGRIGVPPNGRDAQRAWIAPMMLALPLAILGCDDTLQPSTVQLDDFASQYARTVCQAQEACCQMSAGDEDAGTDRGRDAGDHGTTGDCEANVVDMVDATFMRAAIYRSDVAVDCLDERATLTGCARFATSATCVRVTDLPLLDPDALGLSDAGVPAALCPAP